MIPPSQDLSLQTSVDHFLSDLFTPDLLKTNPDCLLHAFINKNANKLITTTLEKSTKQIDLQVTSHRLSPLHVAVLKGNRAAVGLLLAQGASRSCQDVHGCTPLHLAAMLQRNEILKDLKESQENRGQAAASAILNFSGDTCDTIEESLRNPPIVHDRVVSYYEKDGVVTPLSAAAFKALTKTDYCSTILATPEILFRKWQQLPDEDQEPFSQELHTALQAYHTYQPKLILAEEQIGKLSIGLGVKAGENIEKGQIIRLYAGEFDVNLGSSYRAGSWQGCIEASRYGNEASRINDGFPNCTRLSVGSKEYVIALNTIKPKEGLRMDYRIGHTTTKFGRYAIDDLKAPESLARQWDNKMEQLTSDNTAKSRAIHVQWGYLFHTPYVLTHLLLHGSIPEGLVAHFITNEVGKRVIQLNGNTNKNADFALNYYGALLELLRLLQGHLLRKPVLEYFKKFLQNQPVILTIQQINYLNKNKKQLLASLVKWEEHKKWIDTCVAIQHEIMAAAQVITQPNQIPDDAKDRLLKIFEHNAKWIWETKQTPDLIGICLHFGVSYEAKKAVTQLLNSFINDMREDQEPKTSTQASLKRET